MTLANEHCRPDVARLDDSAIAALLPQVPGWQVEGGKLVKVYRFADYYQTLAFVNAAALVSHREDHHPELLVTYNTCKVAWDTHSVNGLSRNDFICAARFDAVHG